jgi:hypothetical protein
LPLLIVAYRADAIRCHRAESWGILILLARGHSLPSR